ncbi:D-alanyl-D-alanine carboxypeptidase / D-alanyl-D-alanine-endopeptidase (penicillin-binding protein 4) [Corynebacterium pollutisoli]|uniref:D-alanyl-D-alanine carboxypeptidase / D-alanyl-D-alanine-endopeptidase (Penicillin-binding protein 4) n=1 Tax=Corynebacterium pollutisoli TaxID=1610489 RepID=A0A1X7J3Z6_9CORY|nr:D-alanyl-D-alanine carboxypeptidase/D-alanyl-D-alanine-endopeptidase [Corynebacterium pollutisoli]SMG21974.1 D-alanyl-D-alanine carboxypeptidase / D-alanyl-D-alanine-endopeptidase (penicillin-binding protein 4) [Corynebacterium pollutisoli]
MIGKKLWWSLAAVVTAVAVSGVAGFAVVADRHYGDLTHAPAYVAEEPSPLLEPATAETVDNAALGARLTALAGNPALGTVHGRVTDTVTGETVWEQAAGEALQPASATKILTGAAAILELGPDDTLVTEVVEGPQPGTVVIRAVGDVWLTSGQMDSLAEQIGEADQVIIDTSAWDGDPFMPGWDPADVDAGYIAPLEPAMLYGARLGETEGDVPRSHTPALDVAQALADRVGAATVGIGPAPADATVLASVESPLLTERLEAMMMDSDNIMAEAIGHELAVHRGLPGSAAAATQATLDVLTEHGFDVTGVFLADNSGLSVHNLIPPRLLDDVLLDAATSPRLRPLLATLPVAGGSGTLVQRYGDLPGRGWVRAKTGTLTGTSALAGVVTAESGRVYSFALLVNGAEILGARAALDEFTSAIRES